MTSEGARGNLIPEDFSDVFLVAGLRRRDESVLRALIETHGTFVYGKALQILKDPVLAEEVAQDALLALWENPQRYDSSKGRLRSFLLGIARFGAIDRVRQEEAVRSRQALFSDAGPILEAPPSDRGVGEALVMQDAVVQLPPAKREAVFLAYYKGLTYREVAQVLGRSEGTVKTQIRDSLIKLRTILGPSRDDVTFPERLLDR